VDMPPDASAAAALIARLDAVAERLARHAAAGGPPDLTEPDPATGERWDAGQVWAHLVEFVPYWMAQLRRILEARSPEPLAFGRVKSDAGRLAAIEAGRHESPRAQMARLGAAIAELRGMLGELPPAAWSARGQHSTRGAMDLARIVEEFLVGHLEEHADQLDGLAPS